MGIRGRIVPSKAELSLTKYTRCGITKNNLTLPVPARATMVELQRENKNYHFIEKYLKYLQINNE